MYVNICKYNSISVYRCILYRIISEHKPQISARDGDLRAWALSCAC